MARKKKDDGLTAFALVVGAVLAVAPFALLYLGFRSGPRLTRHVDDYALTHDEAHALQHSSRRLSTLDAQHRRHLSKGLTMTKSGEFDRRSNAGKAAFEVHAQLNQAIDDCSELQDRPLNRLCEAVDFAKLHDAARFALLGFVAWFAYAAMYMRGPNFGWPSTYFMASAVSLGVFAVVWLWFSIYYWASFSQLREQLKPQPA